MDKITVHISSRLTLLDSCIFGSFLLGLVGVLFTELLRLFAERFKDIASHDT
jgi:hypothetical protein